jgi:hypothetical protein
MKIRELRTVSERELNPKFEVRRFHDVVLGSGSVPFGVLEDNVPLWVAAEEARPLRALRRWGGERPQKREVGLPRLPRPLAALTHPADRDEIDTARLPSTELSGEDLC